MFKGILALTLSALTAFGASMDPETRNLLISKFEKVLVTLAPSDASYTGVNLRLADLLAERARFDSMKELESGCVECKAGISDRQKALRLYEGILAKVPADQQGKVILQMGHLNDLLGQSQKAEKVWLEVIRQNSSAPLVAEARAALGEMYFKKRQFKQAREQFEAARRGELNQKGLAAYRIGWCFFNEGRIAEAASELKTILNTPQLLTRSSDSAVVSVDKQFQEEVSRDYATFMARLGGDRTTAEEIHRLSPENAKLANVEFFATELERLGVKEKSVAAWQFVQELQTQPRARLEGNVRLSQLYLDIGKQDLAVLEFEKAIALWPQAGCDTTCTELKSRLRKFVIDWHRGTKANPKPEVLASYENYLSLFGDDLEMIFWSAQLAKDLKNWAKSIQQFKAYVSAANGKAQSLTGKDRETLITNIEGALLSIIEVAELSQNATLQAEAYTLYSTQSPKKDKLVEVEYQKAHLLYKQEKYSEAAEALKVVALMNTTQSPKIREQAADLALDALAILKDDAKIEAWSTEFSNRFPSQRGDFQAVSRKSLLNQVAANQDPQVAWIMLGRVDLTGADKSDRILYYKDKIILAEKLGRYSEGRTASEALLKIEGLSAEDTEFALAKKSWFAELALDFPAAYEANTKMKLAELKPDQKVLRLAMFAELAGQKADGFYEQYMKATQDQESGRLVAARLVRESKAPEKDLKRFESVLKADPLLTAQLWLEVYSANRKKEIAKAVVSDKKLAVTPAGKDLAREILLQEMKPLAQQLSAAQIGTRNQSEISKGIKTRVALIEKLEAMTSRAVESGDWIAQTVGLSYLGQEIPRFYNELIALPIPQGLTPEEEGQYLQLLSQQASPYQLKGTDIQTKLKEIWSIGQLAKILTDFDQLTGTLRDLYKSQLSTLAELAPAEPKAQIVASVERPVVGAVAMPSVAEIESARKAVRENPMSRDNILRLSELEKKMGRSTMAAYLEARAQKLAGVKP